MEEIVQDLRKLADEVESGNYGDPTCMAFVLGDKKNILVSGYYGCLAPEHDVAIMLFRCGIEDMEERKIIDSPCVERVIQ